MKPRPQTAQFMINYQKVIDDFEQLFYHEIIPAKVLNKRIKNVTKKKSTKSFKEHLIKDGYIKYDQRTRSYVNKYYLLYGTLNDVKSILNAIPIQSMPSQAGIKWLKSKRVNKPQPKPRPEQDEFRKAVLQRAGYQCILCDKEEELEAHHLESYHSNPFLRADQDNGACLCHYCHRLFHKEYGTRNNTVVEFNEFYSNYKL